MGTVESSQSSDVPGIGGLAHQSSFHRQSPNVARLIRSENSSKMEYEFPISDVPSPSSHHHTSGSGNTSNHAIAPSSSSQRHNHSSSSPYSSTSSSSPPLLQSGALLGNADSSMPTKSSSNSSSSLWLSLTSCFGCRMRHSRSSTMNPLRDKVHAIRIVRASNDLTPAVFDSHYNIITLEQLRECDNNGSANVSSAANDASEPVSSEASTASVTAPNGTGSTTASSATTGSKKDSGQRMRKKKKKRTTGAAGHGAKTGRGSDDENDVSGRT